MRRFAVIGLGRFGSSIARTLGEKGQQVLAIDKNENLVNDIMDHVTKAVCLDASDEKAVKSAGLQDVEVAVCAIATDVESSVLITLLLKELGIPTIVCKANDEAHKKALEKIGATRVVLPETEMGSRIANTLLSSSDKVVEHVDVSDVSSIIEIKPPEEFIGKSLRELKVRAEYGVTVIAIKRKVKAVKGGESIEEEHIDINPQADDIITKGDILVVFGGNEKIEALKKKK
jgi:trk system potassium uptake protein TrkA